MGFIDELANAAKVGAQGAVRDAAGAAVASGETSFAKATGTKVAQPLPPAGPAATAAGSSTSSAGSPTSSDSVNLGGFRVNKPVLIAAGVALVALVLWKYRGALRRG